MNGFIVILAPSYAKDHKVIRNSELIAMMLGASSNTQQTKRQTKEMIVKQGQQKEGVTGIRYGKLLNLHPSPNQSVQGA